jgi:hypothetical protein
MCIPQASYAHCNPAPVRRAQFRSVVRYLFFVTLAILRSAFLGAVLPAALAFGASGFDGHWLARGDNEPRIWAWSLEITGSQTAEPGGWFVTAFGGDRNKIVNAKVENGEFSFSFERPRQEGPPARLLYRFRLDGPDRLRGTFQRGDDVPMKWIGWRAPVLTEKDDGTWKEGQPVVLFDGATLSGWKNAEGWEVTQGIMRNKPPVRDVISEKMFWNFKLEMEYRLQKGSNSGLGLRGRYEIQLLDDYGRPQNSHNHGALYSRITPRVNASKPAGEWQTMEVRLVGRDLTVTLNGQKVIEHGVVEGLTAIATNPDEDQPGPIQLQGDHTQVELRRMVVTPLYR